MKKPKIGMACGFLEDDGGMFPGYKRDYANEDYIAAVTRNGGIPILLPLLDSPEDIEQQIDGVDALLLMGGHDVDPSNYNADPEQKLGDTSLRRDAFELSLIHYAQKRNLPILGICRGFQLINVLQGGTIYQDVSYRPEPTIRHWQEHNPTQPTHEVTIEQETVLADIIGKEKLRVNSFHHQIMNKLGDNLEPMAHANDGVTEAFLATDYSFMMGIQWHPEMLSRVDVDANKIFKYFIDQVHGE